MPYVLVVGRSSHNNNMSIRGIAGHCNRAQRIVITAVTGYW